MAAAVLDVVNCSYSYPGGDFCLRDVSVGVNAGEVLGIVGPNGSGKSTLLRLMSNFLRPDEGNITLDGKPLDSFSRRRLARSLAFLPERPETSFAFSARDVVAMGRYSHQGAFGFLRQSDMEVVERALEETGTAGLAGRTFFTLSGGEKQRVLVASVLAQEPSVMLLDEPTAALDIHHKAEVFDLLWTLSRKGMAVVVVTHDLNAAGQFCDRLVLLSEGRVIRSGPPADVMDRTLLADVYGAEVRVVRDPATSTSIVVVLGKTAHGAS